MRSVSLGLNKTKWGMGAHLLNSPCTGHWKRQDSWQKEKGGAWPDFNFKAGLIEFFLNSECWIDLGKLPVSFCVCTRNSILLLTILFYVGPYGSTHPLRHPRLCWPSLSFIHTAPYRLKKVIRWCLYQLTYSRFKLVANQVTSEVQIRSLSA